MDNQAHKRVNNYYQWTHRFNIVATLITILIAEVMIFLHQTGILVMVSGNVNY